MKRNQPIKYRIFVGGRPYADLSESERERFGASVSNRIGDSLNDYFSANPGVYASVIRNGEMAS